MSGGTIKPTHRHVKRGTEYQHIGTARIQTDVPLQDMDRVEVYIGRGDDDLWARRQVEFHDGRFEPVATPANATDTAGLAERFDPHEDFSAMSQNPDGRYVRYADFAALRAENERLTAERDKANQRAESQWAGWIKEGVARKAADAERDRLQAELNAHTAAQPDPDAVAEADPAGVAAATEVIQWQGKEVTACAMIQHIADTLKEKGKGLITTDPASFGQVILEFDAALTALGEKAKP